MSSSVLQRRLGAINNGTTSGLRRRPASRFEHGGASTIINPGSGVQDVWETGGGPTTGGALGTQVDAYSSRFGTARSLGDRHDHELPESSAPEPTQP